MLVKSRSGEPLGRIISVTKDGFVIERKVVVTRERRVGFDEVHALEGQEVVLDQGGPPPRHFEETDLLEVYWTARRARDEQRPAAGQEGPEPGGAHRMVAVTEHAGAYPILVERGTVRAPRSLPLSEE